MRAALSIPIAGKTVLDVGCGEAETFALPEYRGADLYGVDVDRRAIAKAQAAFPRATFRIAPAEKLPFADNTFDSVISRVALPYTDIPMALREIHRVLKPGGDLWATLHSFSLQWMWLKASWRARTWVRVADHAYVFSASLAHWIGWQIPSRPWNGTRESCQTEYGMRRDLEIVGFGNIKFSRSGSNFIVTANRV